MKRQEFDYDSRLPKFLHSELDRICRDPDEGALAVVHFLNDLAAEDGYDGPMDHWEEYDLIRGSLENMRDACQELINLIPRQR